MSNNMELGRLVDQTLATPQKGQRFPPLLEDRYQYDIHLQHCRHLVLFLIIGLLSYESFLFWWWLLLGESLSWAARYMAGICIPVTLLSILLMPRLPPRWREYLAMLPFYVALLMVYHVVVNSPPALAANPTLYICIFTWPLIPAYSNICLRCPLRPVLWFNFFCLLIIVAGALQVPAPQSLSVLMVVNAVVLAFFSILASHWLDIEGRRSYLYRIRDELHLAKLSSANRDLQRLSETDSLTELANRRGLSTLLELFWRQRQEGRSGALLLLDVDFFKPYNDHYGHQAGDSCLRRVGDALRQALRPGDCIGRYGGEEFLVLLDQVRPNESQRIAERLLQSVRDLRIPHASRPDGLRSLTVSGGLVDRLTPTVQSFDELLSLADQALYRAKAAGRNGCCDAKAQEASVTVQLPPLGPEDLRLGLALNQFSLVFQPLYRVSDKRLLGYEALLRWHHPQRGSIPPARFIPLAERHGLIDGLGDRALREACSLASHWPAELRLSINLSPLQLHNPELPERIAAILASTGLAGERLILELTEGERLDPDQQVHDAITALQRLGVRLALDDFGMGNANLGYLLVLNFQWVKIDRRILAIKQSQKRQEVLQALQHLARTFELRVLCEGVEHPEQWALLQTMGMDEAQGYWLGQPQPVPLHLQTGVALQSG